MKLIYLVRISLVLLIGVLIFFSVRMYTQLQAELADPTPSVNCEEGYTVGMTPREISELMGIPLVELKWLPEDVDVTPEVHPHTLEHVDSSSNVTCIIRITYASQQVPRIRDLIEVDVIPLFQTQQTPFPVSCHSLDEDYEELKSRCSGEIVTPNGLIAVSMFTQFPLEIAEQIAESIEVVTDE